MRSPHDLAQWASRKVHAGQSRWLTQVDLGESEEFSFPLQPPRENDMATGADQIAAWVQAWARFPQRPGITLEWMDRRWLSRGTQHLPNRVRVRGARALTALAGQTTSWKSLCDKVLLLRSALGDDIAPALPAIATRLATLSSENQSRLVATVQWLLAHPDSDMFIRELPIHGIDTKWLEHHRGLVNPIMRALTGRNDLGLRQDPQRFRVRILDSAIVASLRDFTASAEDLAALQLSPRCVVLCENLISVLALGSFPGVIAIHGQGYHVTDLADIAWINQARVIYWGDLDTHGFRILSLARQQWPQTESLLMDAETLKQFAAYVVSEPRPYRNPIGYLTADETAALTLLRTGDQRLEQERIAWDVADQAIRTKIGAQLSS